MYCRNCGHEIADEAVLCVKCGVPAFQTAKFCQYCGRETAPGLAICGNCGVKLKSHSGEGRDWTAAMLLSILPVFFGVCGIHRFYTGHTVIGVVQLLTGGGCFIWQLIDIISIATYKFKDSDGRELKK